MNGCVWRSKESFWELLLSFHCVYPRDQGLQASWQILLPAKPFFAVTYLCICEGCFDININLIIFSFLRSTP